MAIKEPPVAQAGRRAPSPSPPISRPTPAARRSDTPRKAGAQVAGRISGNVTRCQEASKHTQNEVHHARAVSSTKGVLRPDSSEKQTMLKSSGGTYSKPDARVKLIPAEEITYVQHRKPYYRSVGLTELQRRHCRRSITPPRSCKVPVVPMSSVSRKRLETTENGDSLVGEHITSSVTHQISSLKNLAPPSCKSSQPSSTSEWPNSLPKEASICSASPGSEQALAPRSNEDHLGTEAGPSSKSLCAPESEELVSSTSVFRQQPTLVYPDRIRTAAPILRKHMLQHKSIPRTHCLQSSAPTQCSTSFKCDTSTEFLHKGVQETGAPVILHTKLHKKHYQSEAPWKGNFHVTGELKHICDGLQAHFPFQVFVRVYEASKQMPEILKLEAVALSQLWPKKFKMKRPDGQDIGLYFISSHQRPHRSFDNLLEKISSHIGLWTNIGDIELSIFSSKLLSLECQRKDDKFYFWGIFGKRLRKNQRHHSNHTTSMKNSNLSQPNEDSDDKSAEAVVKLSATEETQSVQPENGMTVNPRGGKEREMGKSMKKSSTIDVIEDNVTVSDKNEGLANVMDVTGGKETDRVNECAAVLGTPNSYPASSCAAPAASLNGCCSCETANKSTSNVAGYTIPKIAAMFA